MPVFQKLIATLRSLSTTSRLLVFYTTCLLLYFFVWGENFLASARFPDILIAPIMTLGSFVAGSTFLGGGAVAFPALTKILHTDPVTAKTFSLAIQSVGMSSAALYIFAKVSDLPLRFIVVYLLATSCGIALSLGALESAIPNTDLRIGFTLFIVCFLAVYMRAISTSDLHTPRKITFSFYDYKLILLCGVIGGLISGLLGSGADLIGFCLLTLYFRLDIKLATQTSVVVMAGTSLVGVFFQGLIYQNMNSDVLTLWYLAAPVVLIGAPLGAVFCRRINEKKLIAFICTIVSIEVLSTVILIPIEKNRIIYYLAASLVSLAIFIVLKKFAFFKHR